MIDVDRLIQGALIAVAVASFALYVGERARYDRLSEATNLTTALADRCVAEIQGASDSLQAAIARVREGGR